jgi:hypothetical protein
LTSRPHADAVHAAIAAQDAYQAAEQPVQTCRTAYAERYRAAVSGGWSDAELTQLDLPVEALSRARGGRRGGEPPRKPSPTSRPRLVSTARRGPTPAPRTGTPTRPMPPPALPAPAFAAPSPPQQTPTGPPMPVLP